MDAIIGLIKEIKICQASGALSSSLAMSFVCIDVMTFLEMPLNKQTQTGKDFINWVDKYLKAEPEQLYQYSGVDVYAARCAMLHQYGSETSLHIKNSTVKQFGYHDGGKHSISKEASNLILISVPSFINDLLKGLQEFIENISKDSDLKKRVEFRMPKLLIAFPINH